MNNLTLQAPQNTSWTDLFAIGTTVAKSGLFGQISSELGFTIILTCLQENISINTFSHRYDIISGKIAYKTAYLLSLFIEAGGTIEVNTYTPKEVTVAFTYAKYKEGKEPYTFTTTFEQYKQKGVIYNGRGQIKDNWQTYPENMLFCRCVSSALRHVAPDVSHGIYTTEEMADTINAEVSPAPYDTGSQSPEAIQEIIAAQATRIPATPSVPVVTPPAPPSTEQTPPKQEDHTICHVEGHLYGKPWETLTSDLLNAALTNPKVMPYVTPEETTYIKEIINARSQTTN